MKFLQQSLIPDPLGAILAKARQKKRLSLEQAARNAGIPEA
jgi:cytoskeletal protein RodZ